MADGDGDRLLLKPGSFYERSGITYAEATRVAGIDRAAREVVTEAGARWPTPPGSAPGWPGRAMRS